MDFYDAMRKHYPYTDRLIDSFIAHTNADQKLGHESVFLEMCGSVPPLSMAEVKDAMNIVRMMVIGGDYCGDDEVYIVRVADRQGISIKKADLFREDFSLQFA